MKIEETPKRNFKLIRRYNLKVGEVLKLKKEFYGLREVTIEHIHSLYGWILLKETEQLPQEVEELIKLIDKRGLK